MDDLIDEVLNKLQQTNLTKATDPRSSPSSLPSPSTVFSPSKDTRSCSNNGWRTIDWSKQEQQREDVVVPTPPPPPPPSPVDIILVRDRVVYLKRDDQLKLPGSQISGNKARKMLSLNALASPLVEDDSFPACLVSYGGPQSNAMLALAAVVHFHNQNNHHHQKQQTPPKRFVYYTKKLPKFLRNQPSGNLFRALSLGMELRELDLVEYNDLFGGDFGGSADPPPNLVPPVDGDSVWIPQGAASEVAIAGTRLLAQEIWQYWSEHGRGRPLSVVLPGGTCSTALLVHQALLKLQQQQQQKEQVLDIQVVVIPCVGDDGYARRQMLSLNTRTNGNGDDIPAILSPAPEDTSYFGQHSSTGTKEGYFSFGEPHASILNVFREMKEENEVLLDLLYGAPAWTIMLRHWRTKDPHSLLSGREIMYVHSGGIEGINSQLLRYKNKGLVDEEDIQLPGKKKRQRQENSND